MPDFKEKEIGRLGKLIQKTKKERSQQMKKPANLMPEGGKIVAGRKLK